MCSVILVACQEIATCSWSAAEWSDSSALFSEYRSWCLHLWIYIVALSSDGTDPSIRYTLKGCPFWHLAPWSGFGAVMLCDTQAIPRAGGRDCSFLWATWTCSKGDPGKCVFKGEECENFYSSLPPEYANRPVGIFFYWICMACA